jgi:16S rRNA (cytidine1402-2'-O)-methyltransferase
LAREFAAREAAGELKGEVTVLIGGASESAPAAPTADLAAQVDRLTAAGGRLKDAVDLVAGANAVSRRALYQAVLEARADPGA